MKKTTSTILSVFPILCILVWSAVAQPTAGPDDFVEPVHPPLQSDTGSDAEQQAKLEQAVIEVQTRLHMPALLEASDDEAHEAEIAELYHSGWIVKATVDDVELALQKAATTPDPEDNMSALILAHRASCRFFVEE